MKRIIKLTERDLTRIVKRVMNEAVESTPALSANDVVNEIKKNIVNSKAYISDLSGNKHLVKAAGSGTGNNVSLIVKDPIAFAGNEQINLTIPGCTVYKPDSNYGIVVQKGTSIYSKYKISCKYNDAYGPLKMPVIVSFTNTSTRIDPA
jgi:hypothetical protein